MPYQITSKVNSALHAHHIKPVSESPALYTSHTVKTFAQSLIGLFIPLFIFTLPNQPILTENSTIDGILLILSFYFVRSIFALLMMNFITNSIFGFLNFKKSIFLGNVLLAISLILLSLSTQSLIFLYISAFVFAAETTLYWVPYHLFFIRKASSKDGHYGHSYGMRILLSKLASAAGPLLGGLLITYLNFMYLFSAATILILVSAIPILFSVHEDKHGKHNAKHIFGKLIKSKSLKNDTIAMASVESDTVMYAIFWPLLMFITAASSFAKVGVISSVSITISSLSALIIGNLVDKKGAKFIHKIGCTINGILYIPRFLFQIYKLCLSWIL